MKLKKSTVRSIPNSFLLVLIFLSTSFFAVAQIPPPGYHRALDLQEVERTKPRLDRDSITVIDTTIIFDPETYEESVKVIVSTYSLREYCRHFYGMQNPDILLDGRPHTIIDPRNYEEITIRLTPDNKIETIPK